MNKPKKKHMIIGIALILMLTISLSGCVSLCKKQSDDYYKEKIAEYFSDWSDDYILLRDWNGNYRQFTIYSFDPDDPANANIVGGWASGTIDTCGSISNIFYS